PSPFLSLRAVRPMHLVNQPHARAPHVPVSASQAALLSSGRHASSTQAFDLPLASGCAPFPPCESAPCSCSARSCVCFSSCSSFFRPPCKLYSGLRPSSRFGLCALCTL